MATGRHARRRRLARHVLLHRFDGERTAGPFPIPAQAVTGDDTGALFQTLLQAGHRIRGEIPATICAAFPLLNQHRLRRPIEIVPLQPHDVGDPSATPEHPEEEGAIQRMLDRREELAHLLLGQAFGKGSAAP